MNRMNLFLFIFFFNSLREIFANDEPEKYCTPSGCVCSESSIDGGCSSRSGYSNWCWLDSVKIGVCPDERGASYRPAFFGNYPWAYCEVCKKPTMCNSPTCPPTSPPYVLSCCPSGFVGSAEGTCNKYQTCPPTFLN